MAPLNGPSLLAKRVYCDYYGCYTSTWNDWGRWVALTVIVVAVLLIAFLFSCYNTRRRRRQGLAPMYGTGWIPAGKPPVGQQQYGGYYANQPYHGGQPAPPYAPPMPQQQTGTTFNSNDGYYGGHNNIELQQPSSAYQPARGGDPVYEAPLGPPPARKGDAIIR
ncbi:chitin synthesis regulation, resistance to congo red-domain-containing protein [Tricladium varicosporioides]|nr:chitin synthesis regulation, resistance to congo red-domain-containing protein [Hymenoscyphus varicosporioides]